VAMHPGQQGDHVDQSGRSDARTPVVGAPAAQVERDIVLIRIEELRTTLRVTKSDDMREALELTLADCLLQLTDLEVQLETEPQ
jgi:hypothetical protein